MFSDSTFWGVGVGVKNLYVADINIYSSPVGIRQHDSESPKTT